MKFCGNCGQQLEDSAVFCSSCGVNVGEPVAPQSPVQEQPVQQSYAQPQQPVYIPDPVNTAPVNNDPYPINVTHKGFWSLGFFFGIVGLILYFVMKNSKPRLARSALKGFIAGCILYGVVITLYIIIAVVGAVAIM